MTMSNEKLVNMFKYDNVRKGKSARMFIEGDVLYDFGYHFPLLVRAESMGIVMNADKYSSTTSYHQRIGQRVADVVIPFSVLVNAGIMRNGEIGHNLVIALNKLELVDISTGVYVKRHYINKGGERMEYDERRPDALVFKHGENFYLSSMDGWNYFFTQLHREANTVGEAFACLKPDIVQGVEGEDYLRQGEWFFVPVASTVFSNMPVKMGDKGLGKVIRRTYAGDREAREPAKFLLPHTRMQPHHYATQYGSIDGCEYQLVRGIVRHSEGDHRMLKLGDGKTWYIAAESNHVMSWGANGKVD